MTLRNKIWRFKAGLKFYIKSKTIYSIHSKFLFKLLLEVFEERKNYYDFADIEAIRHQYLANDKVLNINDLGAGSLNNTRNKTVQEVARVSASTATKGQALFNLARLANPSQILEFGTNLGIGSLYLSRGAKSASMTTLEGDFSLHQISQATFKDLKAPINAIHTSFENYLSSDIKLDDFDLVYIDGNHQYDFTTALFDKLNVMTGKQRLLIFDDIYWNQEMYKAWQYIINKVQNAYTIETLSLGIVIMGPHILNKQHFNFIRKKFKPIQIPFFG